MDDLEIYRSAKLYIDQYGADASVHAAMKAETMMRAGDQQGYAVWMPIGRAIDDMQATAGRMKH